MPLPRQRSTLLYSLGRRIEVLRGMIDIKSDDYFMGEALRQARKAFAVQEVPVGAIVVLDQHIVARAYNQVELLKDGTAHAEMLALTQAQEVAGDWRLNSCSLYVTKEPCAMCAGASVQVRIGRVIYGVSDPKMGAAGGTINLLQHPSFNHRCDITTGVRREECHALLKAFFADKRLANPPIRPRRRNDNGDAFSGDLTDGD